jgi:tetratricopeptide (TPR) repeat protein
MTDGISGGSGSLHNVRREFRVFILSTFRDLHAEREYLRKHVFPEVRQRCRLRSVEFAEVDLHPPLRRGERPDEAYVNATLDEITRQCPYVIGVIGSRYAWLPDAEGADPLDRFLADIAIMEGLLENPLMSGRTFFFQRDRSVEADPVETQDDLSRLRTERLLSRIAADGFPIHCGFTSLEEFGSWVEEDLLGAIDRVHPQREQLSPLETARRAHEAFAETRRRAYVEVGDYFAMLDAHAASDGPPLVVTGETGSGKSALLAQWSRRHRSLHPESFVITHYVGVTAAGGDHLALIQRIMGEIRERYGLREEIPVDPQEIVSAFPFWLAHVQRERLVLIIDAVDRFDEAGADLRWLPDYIQPRVRLILSCSDPEQGELARRGWDLLSVRRLSIRERKELVSRVFGETTALADGDVAQRIAVGEPIGNPLFLTTTLREIKRELEQGSTAASVDRFLAAGTIGELFQYVLERFEQRLGGDSVRSAMTLLWVSRSGLSIEELTAISGADGCSPDEVLRAMESYLIRRDGLFSFFHDQFRAAVAERYALEETSAEILHLRRHLAGYVAEHALPDRVATELPWQLYRSGDLAALAGRLVDPAIFLELFGGSNHGDLRTYWMALSPSIDVEDAYRGALLDPAINAARGVDPAHLYDSVGSFLMEVGRYRGAEQFCRRALDARRAAPNDDPVAIVATLLRLSVIESKLANFEQAERALEEALALLRPSIEQYGESYADILEAFGVFCYNTSNYAAARSYLEECLRLRERILGEEHPDTATTLGSIGAVMIGVGDAQSAQILFRRVLVIQERSLGLEHPAIATCLNNLATTMILQGQIGDAISLLERALAINEGALGPDHVETLSVIMNLAVLRRRSSEFDRAAELMRRALEGSERTFGRDHPFTADCANNCGSLLMSVGDFAGAQEMFDRALAVREKFLGPENVASINTRLNLAGIMRLRGEVEAAVSAYRQVLPMKITASGIMHPETQLAFEKYRLAVVDLGLDPAADELLRRCES